MKEAIDEIILFLKQYADHVAIIRTMAKHEIDAEQYTFEYVEGRSFSHCFTSKVDYEYLGNVSLGQVIIPIGNENYVLCEWIT